MFSFSRVSKRIKTNEGFRNTIYKDLLGNKTVGFGHLINSRDYFCVKKKYSKRFLSEIFYNDLKKAIFSFKKSYNHRSMPDNAQEVIIEMIFQLGIKKLLKFKKFNFYIKKKQFYMASLEMIKSRWYQQTPKRVNKLIAVLLGSYAR